MDTQIISIGGKEYLKVGLVQFIQKDQAFYLAKIKASDFLKVYTVRPAQYDLERHISLANSFQADDKYYSHLITEDKDNIKEKDFQRDPNNERINKIVKFLNDEEYPFFPNTIISNCELINDWENFDVDEDSSEADFFSLQDKPAFISFLKLQDKNYHLYIPFVANSVLVIDGQHRLVGLERANKEVQDNYDLVVAFIIGYDRSIIAKQFYTINYEQKPVNKSLLYQLTGEFTKEINELSFMHNVVKLLNELENSPFQGRIKMLGTTPKNISPDAKAKLSISQSFLIDSTIRFISAKAKGSLYPPILLKYFKNPDEHIHIVRLIARYFNAVKEIKSDWEIPKESLISKGMGVGALLKTLNLLFPMIFKNEMKSDWQNIKNLQIADFKRILSGLENVDFGTNGPYGKTGSAGSISKIKDGILSNLSYINKPADIHVFEESIKSHYLQKFNEELNKI
ncbi:MAG: DGQHR domain-containing protein [Bacteroidota bacterium]